MGRPRKDLTNVTSGRLTAREAVGVSYRGAVLWRCECSCGNEVIIQSSNLVKTTSCGCLKRELLVERNKSYSTHGMKGTTEWITWQGMFQRCENPNHEAYHNYGGRGIKVCERWRYFENFIEDMGFKPSPELTLERNDNNGNYEPANCRWATRAEQNRNTRVFKGVSGRSIET